MTLQIFRPLAGLIILAFSASSLADVAYRPESDLAKTFVNDVSTAEITVFPTIVRTPYMSRFSTRSQKQVITFLQNNQLGIGKAADKRFYLGALQARAQFGMFQNSMQGIREQLAGFAPEADYVIVIEVIFPPVMSGLTQVFGIHVYVLDADGDNAFSFLMNSHHQAFADARLTSRKDTADSKEQLAIKSTKIALSALKQLVAEVGARLSNAPADEAAKPATGDLTKSQDIFEERRLNGSSSTLILRRDDSNRHVYEKSMDLMCACAHLTTRRGFKFFHMDRQVMLADGRGSFRINFYQAVPDNLRVPDLNDAADILENTDPENTAMDAKVLGDYCELWHRSKPHRH